MIRQGIFQLYFDNSTKNDKYTIVTFNKILWR